MLALADPATAVALAQASRRWAGVAEADFRLRCGRRGWGMPRRPRGLLGSAGNSWKWRTLFLGKSCKACHGDGVFGVLKSKTLGGQAQVALLCRRCALDRDDIKSLLSAEHLSIALCSENGEQLLPEPRKQKRGRPAVAAAAGAAAAAAAAAAADADADAASAAAAAPG